LRKLPAEESKRSAEQRRRRSNHRANLRTRDEGNRFRLRDGAGNSHALLRGKRNRGHNDLLNLNPVMFATALALPDPKPGTFHAIATPGPVAGQWRIEGPLKIWRITLKIRRYDRHAASVSRLRRRSMLPRLPVRWSIPMLRNQCSRGGTIGRRRQGCQRGAAWTLPLDAVSGRTGVSIETVLAAILSYSRLAW
jgi:hypothetical protein